MYCVCLYCVQDGSKADGLLSKVCGRLTCVALAVVVSAGECSGVIVATMTDVAAAPGSDLIPSSHYRVCLRRVVRAPGPAAPPRVCPPEIVYQPLPLTHAAATVPCLPQVL